MGSRQRPVSTISLAEALLKDDDPRLREMAVRMLGRDCRENGHVEYTKPEAKQPPAALAHLEILLAMADDPDAGVRRELILALRNLPTDKVGDALRKLAAAWDGQDRWYLEALGLALEKRESAFLSTLFDGTLYGDLDLDEAGNDGNVALPPYFPVDRNEAYIAAGTPDLPAHAVSKYLGLAWRIHRPRGVAAARAHLAPPARIRAATGRRRHPGADERPGDRGAWWRAWRCGRPTRSTGESCWRCWRAGSAGEWNAASTRPQVLKVIDAERWLIPATAAAGDRAGRRDARRPLPRQSRTPRRGCQGARGGAGCRR